ncbi:CHAT domain-containing protein [bacterium]|nr:CHAT domain-containing protein [bacterium]
MDALPVELLCDDHFFSLKTDTHVIRQVSEKSRLKKKQPEKWPLKLLSTACSPLDLAHATLEFEKEEESIQKEIGPFQVDMTIEDSGSLAGLETALIEADGFEIVHITGHAGIDRDLGPVFYMENEFGELDKVTPDRLAKVLRDYPPQLLFLSGCSTGQSAERHATDSFSHQLVAAGVPLVLGWALPVSDAGATLLTIELYGYLVRVSR